MKQCPQCRTTYTDDTLKFCLADGTPLIELGDEETLVRPGVGTASPPGSYPPKKGVFPVVKLLIALLMLGFLGLLVAGGAGVLFYMNSGGKSKTLAQNSPSPTSSPRPTATPTETPDPDIDQERLEKEMANVLKRLEKELQSNANTTGEPSSSSDPTDGRPTARVNSPGDGFLALRDEPDAETGELLAKIPHGAIVNLENCEKQQTTVSGRAGRWCMVTYQGETGYVFDAWLEYK